MLAFVALVLVVAAFVSAQSNAIGEFSDSRSISFVNIRPGTKLNSAQLSLWETNIVISRNSGSNLKFTLLDAGSRINQEGHNLWVDPASGICSIATITPGTSAVVGKFSLDDGGYLALSSDNEQYGFHACPDANNNYLLYAFPLSSAVIPQKCFPLSLIDTSRMINQSGSQNSVSSNAGGSGSSGPSDFKSLSPVSSSFSKVNTTFASKKNNSSPKEPNSSTKNGRANVLAGVMGLVGFFALM
ncbi:hypothetical protein NEOLI_000999 [Neolecta irregularis DAH-3]|uniref:Uncharacterized protein n=1 Tax=Neolecta irregularis (strain DAH-3) TaxID=1198029 RepID=A0A1U7LVV7_NEOID|nr:hypothetical protein NEOLI_000999 [Neolecta irregularis DAH-3]|eukprot:OLL26816.1 hypothetical protein NEOLI_000999 [Neolecta irregularis DAH-3]